MTRWGTHMDMARSFVKHKSVLKSVIADNLFSECAKSSRTDKQSEEEADLVDLAAVLGGEMNEMHPDMPPHVAGNKRYHTAWTAIRDDRFWHCMQEYISLNEAVSNAITFSGGNNVYLSDACVKMLQLNDFINSIDMSHLLTVGELVDL
jgi:hypothetical protein